MNQNPNPNDLVQLIIALVMIVVCIGYLLPFFKAFFYKNEEYEQWRREQEELEQNIKDK